MLLKKDVLYSLVNKTKLNGYCDKTGGGGGRKKGTLLHKIEIMGSVITTVPTPQSLSCSLAHFLTL